MVKEIDVRGLSCPQPVILVKRVIEAGESNIIVKANDMAAADNVKRLAENNGYSVEIENKGDDIFLKLINK